MNQTCSIAVMGGDGRMCFLCRTLQKAGYTVMSYAVPDHPCEKDWKEVLRRSEVLILPLPMTRDGIRLFAPACEEELPLRLSLIPDLFSGKRILGGKIPPSFYRLFEGRKMQITDYFDNEILQLKNAVPSAEGAICLAMEQLPVTLDGACAGVMGYGRIGQILSEKLASLGARVKVFARRREVLTLASLNHHTPVLLSHEEDYRSFLREARECRVLFNTVPHPILTEERLSQIPRECLLIDLASAPGGIDTGAAQKMGFSAFWATAIPGRCYPESAGIILGESLLTVLEQMGDSPSS